MGKRARLKKQAKIEKILEQKQQVEQRKVVARSSMIRLVKLLLITLAVTAILLYVGQIVNRKIAQAMESAEIVR